MAEKPAKDFRNVIKNKKNFTESPHNFRNTQNNFSIKKPSSKIKSIKFFKDIFSSNYK